MLLIVAWVPIDHDPVPPRVAEWCIKGGNKYIVAMSKHGEQALLKAGVPRDRLTYIPHAIDTKVWLARWADLPRCAARARGCTPYRHHGDEQRQAQVVP